MIGEGWSWFYERRIHDISQLATINIDPNTGARPPKRPELFYNDIQYRELAMMAMVDRLPRRRGVIILIDRNFYLESATTYASSK